ncbi:hypothetical protein [Spirosoma pollinicola]|uniref:Uncharacterized protein n=1 Tax=Spirosoma pollinicola TaxID=2057025 RepID=A0A2K8Z7U2_9BACT|nr:hypothetical protein [Spirosoma pollinicola]AUD05943.1 hypothetical protein CWM47_31325 [Spirosoma pollinicola]
MDNVSNDKYNEYLQNEYRDAWNESLASFYKWKLYDEVHETENNNNLSDEKKRRRARHFTAINKSLLKVKFNAEDTKVEISTSDIASVFPGYILIKLSEYSLVRSQSVIGFYNPTLGDFKEFDGSNTPIYDLSEIYLLISDNKNKFIKETIYKFDTKLIKDFIKLFFNNARGRHGYFYLVESAKEMVEARWASYSKNEVIIKSYENYTYKGLANIQNQNIAVIFDVDNRKILKNLYNELERKYTLVTKKQRQLCWNYFTELEDDLTKEEEKILYTEFGESAILLVVMILKELNEKKSQLIGNYKKNNSYFNDLDEKYRELIDKGEDINTHISKEDKEYYLNIISEINDKIIGISTNEYIYRKFVNILRDSYKNDESLKEILHYITNRTKDIDINKLLKYIDEKEENTEEKKSEENTVLYQFGKWLLNFARDMYKDENNIYNMEFQIEQYYSNSSYREALNKGILAANDEALSQEEISIFEVFNKTKHEYIHNKYTSWISDSINDMTSEDDNIIGYDLIFLEDLNPFSKIELEILKNERNTLVFSYRSYMVSKDSLFRADINFYKNGKIDMTNETLVISGLPEPERLQSDYNLAVMLRSSSNTSDT